MDFEIPEQGINPSVLLNTKNPFRKGFIDDSTLIEIAGSMAIQKCNSDDITHNFVEIFFTELMILSGSVKTKTGSYVTDIYKDVAQNRIMAEDRKSKVLFEGGQVQ